MPSRAHTRAPAQGAADGSDETQEVQEAHALVAAVAAAHGGSSEVLRQADGAACVRFELPLLTATPRGDGGGGEELEMAKAPLQSTAPMRPAREPLHMDLFRTTGECALPGLPPCCFLICVCGCVFGGLVLHNERVRAAWPPPLFPLAVSIG